MDNLRKQADMSKTTAIRMRRNSRHGVAYHRHVVASASSPMKSIPALMRDLGPVVYAVRSREMIKIGHTTNFADRMAHLGVRPYDVLAWRQGTLEDEQRIHAALKGYAVEGNEWYGPDDAVLDVVNEMRADLGLPLLRFSRARR